MPPSQTLMPGLHFEAAEEGRPWSLHADSIDVLRNAFGDDLTVGFVRAFSVRDRLQTILDLVEMNDRVVGRDCVRGERNLHTLGMFAAGLVYEFKECVEDLVRAKVHDRLSPEGMQRWDRLQRLAVLRNEDAIKQLRNLLAFHSGDPDVIRAGLKVMTKRGGPVSIISGRTGENVELRHDFAQNVVLAGIDVRPAGVPKGTPNSRRPMDEDDLKSALEEAIDGHFTVVSLLSDLLHDVLRTAGAGLLPLDPLELEPAP